MMMRLPTFSPRRFASQSLCHKGFTMVELLTVVSIILILGAITIGALGAFNKMTAKKATEARIKLLETKIEEYQLDQGVYPGAEGSLANGGDDSTVPLYEALTRQVVSGSTATDDSSKNKVYWAELRVEDNGIVDSAYRILDGYGQPLRYRTGGVTGQVNPDFDLWSMGPDGKDDNEDDHTNF